MTKPLDLIEVCIFNGACESGIAWLRARRRKDPHATFSKRWADALANDGWNESADYAWWLAVSHLADEWREYGGASPPVNSWRAWLLSLDPLRVERAVYEDAIRNGFEP